MSKYLLYLGCVIPTKQYAYEISLRKVFPKLGVELVDFDERCCGFPLKSINKKAWIYMGARVLARAAEIGLPILTPCNGCNVSLCEVKHILETNEELKIEIQNMLKSEGIHEINDVKVSHPIEVLHDEVGVEKIKEMVTKPLKGIRIAAHPGCHIMRPTNIPRPEDNKNPIKFDNIVKTLGAEAYDYPNKGGCCGATAIPYDPNTAIRVVAEKLLIIINSGFDAATTSCPYCMEMLDAKQDPAKTITGNQKLSLPIFYLTQLVGLALGMNPRELGIHLNMSPVENILEKLGWDIYE